MTDHLYVPHVSPRSGTPMQIPYAHLEIARLISEGDGLNWVGDDRLSVNWDMKAGKYCIVRLCEDRVTRPVMWVPPEEFDARVLKTLAEADLREGRNDVLARVEAHNAEVERDQEREARAMEAELADRLEFIYKRLPESAKY